MILAPVETTFTIVLKIFIISSIYLIKTNTPIPAATFPKNLVATLVTVSAPINLRKRLLPDTIDAPTLSGKDSS